MAVSGEALRRRIRQRLTERLVACRPDVSHLLQGCRDDRGFDLSVSVLGEQPRKLFGHSARELFDHAAKLSLGDFSSEVSGVFVDVLRRRSLEGGGHPLKTRRDTFSERRHHMKESRILGS